MKKRVIIVDTSILVVWLRIPGFSEAGTARLTYTDIDAKLKSEIAKGAILMLTMAVIIETGNHIAQIQNASLRKQMVNQFADFLQTTIETKNAWRVFYQENEFWTPNELQKLATQWRSQGIYKLSLGDASILKVTNCLKPVFDVEVYTGDTQLYSLSLIPITPIYAPKNKRN